MVGDGGEVGGRGAGEGVQGVEGPLVQPPLLPPEEVVVDRLAGQGVAEGEHVLLLLDEQAAPDEGAEVDDEVALGGVRHRREEVEVDATPEHRRRLEHAALVGFELLELAADQLGQAPRERLVGEGLGVELGAGGAEQLLEEERVAAGAGVQRLDDPVARVAAVDGGEEVADLAGLRRSRRTWVTVWRRSRLGSRDDTGWRRLMASGR